MASVDWMKCKGGRDAKAKFWHCDSMKRIEHEHSNKQIDKSRTYLNMPFGAFKGGYDAVCKAYDETIDKLDAQPGANKRKDRVTCVGWTLPVPEGMGERQASRWMTHAYKTLKAQYGDCILGGTAHFDEVHEYKDAETGEARRSRPHLHVYAVPIVAGKLNGKSFTSRKNIVAMNSTIEQMTREYFPGYKFQNGTKKKSKATVEELKNESAQKEAEAKARREALKIVEVARQQAEEMTGKMTAEASQMTAEASQTLAGAFKLLDTVKSTLKDVEELKTAYTASERRMRLMTKFMKQVKMKDSKTGLSTTALDKFERMEREHGYASTAPDVPNPERIADLKRRTANLEEIAQKLNTGMDNDYQFGQ